MSNKTELIFARHGAVDNPDNIIYGRRINVPLSDKGAQQINSLAGILANQGVVPGVIYTSHLSRAVKSAQILKKLLKRLLLFLRKICKTVISHLRCLNGLLPG